MWAALGKMIAMVVTKTIAEQIAKGLAEGKSPTAEK